MIDYKSRYMKTVGTICELYQNKMRDFIKARKEFLDSNNDAESRGLYVGYFFSLLNLASALEAIIDDLPEELQEQIVEPEFFVFFEKSLEQLKKEEEIVCSD